MRCWYLWDSVFHNEKRLGYFVDMIVNQEFVLFGISLMVRWWASTAAILGVWRGRVS